MKTRIFTFWEPKQNIPGYLKLCLETWKKFLPDCEIIILDYSNIDKYLCDDIIKNNIKKFPLAIQSDILKCTILRQYGGLFLDLDTIFTKKEAYDVLFNNKSEFIIFYPHICCIKAEKNSYVLNLWEKRIKERIKFYNKVMKKYHNCFILKILNKRLYKRIKSWDYLGNGILNKIVLKIEDPNLCMLLDKNAYKVMPEFLNEDETKRMPETYRDFYFNNDYSESVLENNSGLLFLHNSWTKKNIRLMSKEEFLKLNNTLANIFKKIL